MGSSRGGGKVHGNRPRRPSRTKLGKGQHAQIPYVFPHLSVNGADLTITFSAPVVINGVIDLGVDGVDLVNTTVNNSTSVTLSYSDDLDGLTYSGFPSGQSPVCGSNGAAFAGIDAGTFD